MMRSFPKLALISALTVASAAAEDVRGILVDRVDKDRQAVGIVVGRIGPNGREVVSYGRTSKNTARTPDGDTIFEIGSITKVFTSLILADMVERGEVKLDDPVAKYVPPELPIPSRDGRQITLLHLSMHMAGLGSPRRMTGYHPRDPNPDRDLAMLRAFLSSVPLARDPGEKYEYSNEGVVLLGRALARRAGLGYDVLVRKRILEPLRMTSSAITLSADQTKRLAAGYDSALKPAASWSTDVLVAAGALRSTANDMLKFIAANLELSETPLKAAMRRMRSVRRPIGMRDTDVAMAWAITKKYGSDVFWHNGGTAGFRTWAGFDPVTKRGAVVLCNTRANIDDIGFHLVDERNPLARSEPERPRSSAKPLKRR